MVQEKEGTGVLLDDSCIRKEETGALEKKESGLMYSIFFFFFFFCLRSFYWRPRFSTPEILLYFSLQHPLHI